METKISNIPEATAAFKSLRQFISPSQMAAIADVCRSEEKEFMFGVLAKLSDTIAMMPKTYETDGQGSAAIVRLHYFVGGCDWYITERDMEIEQHQAFGLANLGYGGELGYISIAEILANGGELDLYWDAKPLSECLKYN